MLTIKVTQHQFNFFFEETKRDHMDIYAKMVLPQIFGNPTQAEVEEWRDDLVDRLKKYAEKTTQLDWVRIVGTSEIMENAHIADEPIPPLAGENEWRRLFSRLDAISNLSDDWDGLGARAPAVEVVMTANVFLNEQRLLSALPPNCVVSASALGSISFEWELTGMYMEAEVDRPWHVSWMKQEANGQFQHWGHDFFAL